MDKTHYCAQFRTKKKNGMLPHAPLRRHHFCEKWWDSLWCQFETRRIYGRLFRTSEREKYGWRIITSAETLRGWSGGHFSSSLTALACQPLLPLLKLLLAQNLCLYLTKQDLNWLYAPTIFPMDYFKMIYIQASVDLILLKNNFEWCTKN